MTRAESVKDQAGAARCAASMEPRTALRSPSSSRHVPRVPTSGAHLSSGARGVLLASSCVGPHYLATQRSKFKVLEGDQGLRHTGHCQAGRAKGSGSLPQDTVKGQASL